LREGLGQVVEDWVQGVEDEIQAEDEIQVVVGRARLVVEGRIRVLGERQCEVSMEENRKTEQVVQPKLEDCLEVGNSLC
jgi:hypothetical protein